ncbi:MAG: protein phosphatase 2C domain-containing protein [Bacteroidota bacterium]|nr:protein phosphatase 2C domain-containing protein [Bacteroidota bacterium]
MKIKIKQPFALHGIGKRKNQEDNIFPVINKADKNTTLFIVCDGVGGMNKGETASDLACREFSKNFKSSVGHLNVAKEEQILQAFENTQNAFDKHIAENPKTKGMATTLVAVHIHEQGLTVTHCGDSRFYHIRNGKILWQTQDHSVINELIKAGVMTEDEAKNSKRNKISRAIQGNKLKKTKPDIHFITDIQKNDYLFLCSDGVSGSITDTELCEILSGKETNPEKMQTINTLCEANSADNYSAYLIQIEEVESEIPKHEIKISEKGFFDNVKSKINKLIKI